MTTPANKPKSLKKSKKSKMRKVLKNLRDIHPLTLTQILLRKGIFQIQAQSRTWKNAAKVSPPEMFETMCRKVASTIQIQLEQPVEDKPKGKYLPSKPLLERAIPLHPSFEDVSRVEWETPDKDKHTSRHTFRY